MISWTRSATQGLIYYNVVRKEDAIPLGVQDGTLVGRVSICSINDQNILPAANIFMPYSLKEREFFRHHWYTGTSDESV